MLEIAKRGRTEFHGRGPGAGERHDEDPVRTRVRRKTRLRVRPGDEPEFEIEAKLIYRRLTLPEVGDEIAVVYDPVDRAKLMIDERAEMESIDRAGMDTANATIAAAGDDPSSLWRAIREAQSVGPGTDATGVPSELIERAMESASGIESAAPGDQETGEGAAHQLETFERLRDQGVITEAQFEAAKATLFGG